MHFNHYDASHTLKATQIDNFFKYVHENTSSSKISADLFGLVTVSNNDLGIGQNLKDAAPNFEALAPMVYPSHYYKGFIGFSNPADHPSEVVEYSMQHALTKLILSETCADVEDASSTVTTASSSLKNCKNKEVKYADAKLRPWLQDFNLGAMYNAEMVRAQINAVDKILKNTPIYDGWMLWNPSNAYTRGALNSE